MNAPGLFETIYATDAWGGGSGPGSRPAFCRPLARWLRGYLADERIGSLVDLGCGDLQWMPEAIAGTGVAYTGIDVVGSLLEDHRRRLPAWSFVTMDVATADPAALPDADLYWAKDVLQHWSTRTIGAWLRRFFAARPAARLVVVNCSGQTERVRRLDDRWRFAPLAPELPPLANWTPDVLFRWHGKAVCLLHASHSARHAA